MDQLDAYLDELVSHLECDPLRRDEIRLEVHAHLRELLEAHRTRGMAAAEAAEAAIREFGPAAEVARRLKAANAGRRPVAVRVPLTRRALGVLAGVLACGIALTGMVLVGWLLVHPQPEAAASIDTAPQLATVLLLAGVLAGALAALVVWWVSRRLWDTTAVCVAIGLVMAALQPNRGSAIYAIYAFLSVPPMLFAGVALVALVLWLRARGSAPLPGRL